MAATVLGIDPGAKGAIATLSSAGELLGVVDMPATPERNGSGRYITDAALLSEVIAESHAGLIFCEFVASRPTDGVIQAFSFGRCRGVVEGIAAAFDLEVIWITPPAWKRHAGVPPGKENKDIARTVAISRWPKHAEQFARKKDVDRAEAALIGAAGLHRRVAPAPPC